MSFSSDVKEELGARIPSARHCQIAELLAVFIFSGKIVREKTGKVHIRFQTECAPLARKCFTLLKKTFNISTDVLLRVSAGSENVVYSLYIRGSEDVQRVLAALKAWEPMREQVGLAAVKSCCKRAFLSGAFLGAGSISNPQNSYHYEIVCKSEEQALVLKELINSFEVGELLQAKVVQRKKYHVVYVKDGSQIVDILNLMGAHQSLMKLETLRVEKEIGNSINRQVNCETANLQKTVSAALKQIQDIKFLKEHGGYVKLTPALIEVAELRLENSELSLKELGELLHPPVGRSGVNHRLRKLCEIAEELREEHP